jgi:hypothetical protein
MMAFYNGGEIDTAKVRELSAQGLNVSQIAKTMGHSRCGIEQHCVKHGIAHTFADKHKYVIVDNVKMTIGNACMLFGFSREGLYSFRVKRGLELQEGFDAYMFYKLTDSTNRPVLTIDTCTVIYQKKTYSLKDICKLLGFHFNSVGAYMKQNKYTQASFDRYCQSMRKL